MRRVTRTAIRVVTLEVETLVAEQEEALVVETLAMGEISVVVLVAALAVMEEVVTLVEAETLGIVVTTPVLVETSKDKGRCMTCIGPFVWRRSSAYCSERGIWIRRPLRRRAISVTRRRATARSSAPCSSARSVLD